MEINRKISINISDTSSYRFPRAGLYPKNDLYPNYYSSTSLDKHIASGTMKLNRTLADNDLVFGELYANAFECTIFDLNDIPAQLVDKNIEVVQQVIENGQISSVKRLFSGTIDSASNDYYNNHQKIVAYDLAYKVRNVNVATAWNGFWQVNESATIKQLREFLCETVDLEYESQTLTNDSVVINKSEMSTEYTSLSFGTIFKMLCELTGTLPNINVDGKVEWIELSTDTEHDIMDLSGNERGSESKYEYYTTKPIDGIYVYSSSNELVQTYPMNGNPSNGYIIAGNIFLLNKSANSIDNICQTLYNKIKGISYVPCEVKLICSDLDIPLGQMITITPNANTSGISYVLTNTLSGIQLVSQVVGSKASGEERDQKANSYNDSIIQDGKISKFEQDIDHIEAQVSALEDGEELVARINLTPGTVKIEAKNIDLSGTVSVSDLAGEGTTTINGSSITS